VERVKYVRTGGVVYRCDLCASLWLTKLEVGWPEPLRLNDYLDSHCLGDGDEEIEWIQRDWIEALGDPGSGS
jgi:hypothetical protein